MLSSLALITSSSHGRYTLASKEAPKPKPEEPKKEGETRYNTACGENPLWEMMYNACLKLAPGTLSDPLRAFLEEQKYELSTEDQILLGQILCLKGADLDIKGQKDLLSLLVPLLQQVKEFAQRYSNRGVIVVSKSQRLIFYAEKGEIIDEMVDRIALGSHPESDGPKERLHDRRTPEGEYQVVSKNAEGSQFCYFLGINYPTTEQADRALHEGKITKHQRDAIASANRNKRMPPANTPLGGEIGFHGAPKREGLDESVTEVDWTLGCIAMENYMVRKYYTKVKMGTPVLILH